MNPPDLITLYRQGVMKIATQQRATHEPSGLFNDSMGGHCLRKRALKRSGAEALVADAKSECEFAFGHAAHEHMLAAIKAAVPEAIVEYTMKDDHSTGRLDLFIGTTLIDVKTVKDYALKKRRKEGMDSSNRLQVCRNALKGEREGKLIEHVGVWYVPKTDFLFKDMIQFTEPWDDAHRRLAELDLQSEIMAWQEFQTTQTLPPPVPMESSGEPHWTCQWCAYCLHCPPANQQGNKYLKGAT